MRLDWAEVLIEPGNEHPLRMVIRWVCTTNMGKEIARHDMCTSEAIDP